MNLDELAAYLDPLVAPVKVLTHHLPAEVKKGVMLRLPLTGVPIDQELPGRYKVELQAIVRAPKQADGDVVADKVLAALTMQHQTEFPSMTIIRMIPKTKPIVYPRSESGGIEWSMNFAVIFVDPA